MTSIQNKFAIASMGGLLLIPLISTGLWRTNAALQLPAQAHLARENLSPVSPDEPLEDTLSDRFSLANSLERLQQIRGALSSFVQLTEKSKPALGERAIARIGNTDWEIQNLGFPNWVGSVEGTLRKQDYQIKKLEFELATKQYEDGEVSQAVLDEKEVAYRLAEQEFRAFWHSFEIAD
jgi:hypothetical protein